MFATIVAALIVASCGIVSSDIKGSGNFSTNAYEVDNFTGIEVGNDLGVRIEFNSGSEPKLEITIDDNLHEYLNIGVVDDRLNVVTTSGSDIRPTADVVVAVSGYDVTSLAVSGDASIDTTLPAANTVDLVLNDDGEIAISVDTDTLTAKADNDAVLDLSGRADYVDVTSSSDATVRLSKAQVIDATVNADNDAVVEIEASGSIVGTARSDAVIRTSGGATIDVSTSDDAVVEPI